MIKQNVARDTYNMYKSKKYLSQLLGYYICFKELMVE